MADKLSKTMNQYLHAKMQQKNSLGDDFKMLPLGIPEKKKHSRMSTLHRLRKSNQGITIGLRNY